MHRTDCGGTAYSVGTVYREGKEIYTLLVLILACWRRPAKPTLECGQFATTTTQRTSVSKTLRESLDCLAKLVR
jgi:hypothetical protein